MPVQGTCSRVSFGQRIAPQRTVDPQVALSRSTQPGQHLVDRGSVLVDGCTARLGQPVDGVGCAEFKGWTYKLDGQPGTSHCFHEYQMSLTNPCEDTYGGEGD